MWMSTLISIYIKTVFRLQFVGISICNHCHIKFNISFFISIKLHHMNWLIRKMILYYILKSYNKSCALSYKSHIIIFNIMLWLRNDILYAWIIIHFIAAPKWEPVLCDGMRFTWERAEKSLNNVTALLIVRLNSYSKPECSGHKLIRHGMNEEKFL